jgi:putative transposase
VNALDKLPKSRQSWAKAILHEIWMSGTKEDAIKTFNRFIATCQTKYPKAAECLSKDREELLAFYDFPAEHWQHLRTSNPIESTFATVRLRTSKTKGAGSRAACLAMAFKLVESAQKRWRKLNGSVLLSHDSVLLVDPGNQAI